MKLNDDRNTLLKKNMVSINNFSLRTIANNQTLRQLILFCMVGLAAACVHYLTVVALVEQFSLLPLVANIVAFLVAFNISYLGHRLFTFANATMRHPIAMRRWFLVASINFIANETLYYILMQNFHLDYSIALIIVLSVLPIISFLIAKLWAFNHQTLRHI